MPSTLPEHDRGDLRPVRQQRPERRPAKTSCAVTTMDGVQTINLNVSRENRQIRRVA